MAGWEWGAVLCVSVVSVLILNREDYRYYLMIYIYRYHSVTVNKTRLQIHGQALPSYFFNLWQSVPPCNALLALNVM